MKTLFILNAGPHGGERTYNAARLAGPLTKQGSHEARVFLIGGAASAAHRHRSSMDELAQWTEWADKVLVF